MQQQTMFSDGDTGFEMFWGRYPRKVGKVPALRAWRRARLSGSDQQALHAALDVMKASDQWREAPRFIPHPATFLNQRRWEDDLSAYAATPPSPREWAEAQRLRALSRRGCPHSDPPCPDWRVCCTKIVARLRERRRVETYAAS